MNVTDLLDNALDLPAGRAFAAILGASPSKGARSPILWNAAFIALGRDERMVPMDVGVTRLSDVLAALEADERFIGGAVTMPHKEAIAAWLGADRLTAEAARIGAVNCLFRTADGALCGTNTDGEGALEDLRATVGDLSGRQVLLLGPGGAGKAVAAFVAGAGASVALAARTPQESEDFAKTLRASSVALDAVADLLPGTDILINCTPVGFANGVPAESPVPTAALDHMPVGGAVFDIIYDPAETPLLAAARARGLTTLNGLGMNRLQAVLGFCRAAGADDPAHIRSVMETV